MKRSQILDQAVALLEKEDDWDKGQDAALRGKKYYPHVFSLAMMELGIVPEDSNSVYFVATGKAVMDVIGHLGLVEWMTSTGTSHWEILRVFREAHERALKDEEDQEDEDYEFDRFIL